MAMIASMISRLLATSAYHKVVAVLLAVCVAGFVLGQSARQPHAHSVAAAVTNPAKTASLIAGSLGKPSVASSPIIVALGAPRSRSGHDHGDGEGHDHGKHGDQQNHVPPTYMPLGQFFQGHQDGVTPTGASPLDGGSYFIFTLSAGD